MRDFNQLTQYAKEKVEATETPLNLYHRAQVRKNLIDSVVTVIIASALLALSTTQFTGDTTIQSPAVKQYIQQELVASRTQP
ncbi:MAG: hypothetical protein WCG75_01715 [Armatimonadota bacterium]